MTNIPEKVANTQDSAPSGEPMPSKRQPVSKHARHVAPPKGKSGKQPASKNKANTGAKSANKGTAPGQ